MSNKYADKPQGLSHTLDGVWQSIQNSGKSGVREWVEKIRNAANVARNLEKRNRELEAELDESLDVVRLCVDLMQFGLQEPGQYTAYMRANALLDKHGRKS